MSGNGASSATWRSPVKRSLVSLVASNIVPSLEVLAGILSPLLNAILHGRGSRRQGTQKSED
jgi:hypothetical protein